MSTILRIGDYQNWHNKKNEPDTYRKPFDALVAEGQSAKWQAAGYECRTRLATLSLQEAKDIQELVRLAA